MIKATQRFLRLINIAGTVRAYGLTDLVDEPRVKRSLGYLSLFTPWRRRLYRDRTRGERLRRALQDLGPVYVKFGQILSTRRDLLPPDLAEELALLQDQVPPFPGAEATAIVEEALGDSVKTLFSQFETEPLASASIAQVHAAKLSEGQDVVVKVVRPGIERQLRRDIDLLKAMAGLVERHWSGGSRVRPLDIVREFETVVFDELDMQREAANATLLRHNFEDSRDLYIPEIYWPYCKKRVLVMERVSGLPVGDIERLKAANVNLERLAIRGVRVFYTQVFRDNLFHADMHPGNILVDASTPDDPTFIAMDFGIVASLTPKDLFYISENFMALFNRNYRRVAELHVDAGWVPADTRIDELEAEVRTVGESSFARPLNEISFGELMLKLFQVAHRFRLTIQPQLIMLQKTLLNIEGLGRQLHPNLDIWGVAKPELESIMREKQNPENTLKELAERLPGWLAEAPKMPDLIHRWLNQQAKGGNRSSWDEASIEALTEAVGRGSRRQIKALLGAVLGISSALFIGLEVGPWQLGGYSTLGLVTGVLSLMFFSRAWVGR